MYSILLTDEKVYVYNKKKDKLIEEKIENDIIKNNKIYDIEKLIPILNKLVEKNHLISNLFKTNIEIMYVGQLSPNEHFLYLYLIRHLQSANYTIANILDKLNNNKCLLVLNKIIYYNKTPYPLEKINEIPKHRFTIVGCGNYLDNVLKVLKDKNYSILTYKDSKSMIFKL